MKMLKAVFMHRGYGLGAEGKTSLIARAVESVSVVALAFLAVVILLSLSGKVSASSAFADEHSSEISQEENQGESQEAIQEESAPFEVNHLETTGFDRPVSYHIVFDANGGEGEMATWDVNVAPLDTSSRSLPECTFTREGYEFAQWRTVCPATCKLNAATLDDAQEFEGLSWQPQDASAQQVGWSGPLTLQSFANEEHQIVLQALWRDEKTGALSGIKQPPRRVSSSSVQTIYLYKFGYHGYLSTSTAPSGYGNRTALGVVPRSSSTPVYLLTNPYHPWRYHFTKQDREYNRLGVLGWTRQGVAFYSDDGQGIPIYRFYRPADSAHSYSLNPQLAGFGGEGIGFYTVKYYSLAFNGNGATSGSLATQKLQYGLQYTLPNCPFKWADHTFTGWQAPNGTVYSAGQKVSNLTATSNGTVTMKALWKLSCYRVSFNPNGGSRSLPAAGVVTGADYVVRDPGCTFSRVGYAFSGWNTKADGSGLRLAPQGSLKLQGNAVNVTLYAQWKPLQLQLSLPTTIGLSLNAKGAVSSNATCQIKNTGSVSAELTHLQVIQSGTFNLVRNNPKNNQISLSFDDKAGHKVNLFDCLGGKDHALPESQALCMQVGKSIVPQFSGTCGMIDEAKWGSGVTLAQVRWKFATADATLGYVSLPQAKPVTQKANVGDKIVVAQCSEKRSGYRFTGWNTNAAGSGKKYTPGQTLVCEKATTLYAQWERA